MKRYLAMLCTAILLVCSFGGCVLLPEDGKETTNSSFATESYSGKAEASDLGALQKKIAESGSNVGAAFVGYVKSESTESDLRTSFENSETAKEYPFLSASPLFMTEGQELYAIVPPNGNGTVTVYRSAITDSGEYKDDISKPLYSGKPGEALLLRCNLSEIYSNVLISVAYGSGQVDFRPELSMENGQLQKMMGVYDFSVYSEKPDTQSVEKATELLRETDEIKAAVKQGMKLMYTGDTQMIEGRTCILFALGTDHDDQFVRELYYGVCGNSIYVYKAVNDTWEPLGAG